MLSSKHVFLKRIGMALLCLLWTTILMAQERLTITPHMVINISAQGDEWILFDDQPNSAQAACAIPTTTNPFEHFDARWNGRTFHYPVSVIVDLGYNQNLRRICLDDASGSSDKLEVYSGGTDPTTWDLLFTHQNGNDQECRDINLNTEFLKFTFYSTNTQIREIELYGNQVNVPECPPNNNSCLSDCNCPRFNMEEFIGSNTNIDLPVEKTNAVGFVRNYQGILLNEGYENPDYEGYPNNEYAWSPTDKEVHDFDLFFQGVKDNGIGACADIHRAPPYLVTFEYNGVDFNAAYAFKNGLIDEGTYVKLIERKPFNEEYYPLPENVVIEDPNAYLEYADIMYQFSARYGSPGTSENIKLAPTNEQRVGMDVVQYLENWNEQDKWWHLYLIQDLDFIDPNVEDRLGYFAPFEYAAMSSATWDGHGTTNGVENILRARYPNSIPAGAGPVGMQKSNGNLKLTFGGLADLNTDYVRAVMFWFEHYRPDIEFPFAVINFHDYSRAYSNNDNHGISPEQHDLKTKMEELVEFRDTYLPGVEVWLSEFGYATNPYSSQSADCTLYCNDCSSNDCYETMRELQGQWNVRSFLEIAAAGIDRAMVFNMRDGGPETDAGRFISCGLTYWGEEDGTGFEPKKSWYYIATMKNTLEGTKFDPDFVHNDDNVRIYKFTDDCSDASKTVYAIWSPTSDRADNSTVLANYQLPFISGDATLVEMEINDVDGVRSAMPTCGGVPCLNVTERPKFIVVGDLPEEDFADCDCDYIDYNISGGGSTSSRLKNEQANIGRPYCGEGNDMNSFWAPAANQEVVINLNEEYNVSNFFVYSNNASNGIVKIYIGEPGAWQFYADWNVRNTTPSKWKSFSNLDINTQYLRLVPQSNGIRVHELAVCGIAIDNQPIDCNTGTTSVQPCDDGNPCSINDQEIILNADGSVCVPCQGTLTTCALGITSVVACDDGNPNTINDVQTILDCDGSICIPCMGQSSVGCQIPLSPQMFFNEFGDSGSDDDSEAGSLADEQNIIGDPINGQGNETFLQWRYPWADNTRAYVDLGQVYDISSIHLFDGYGTGQFQVAPGLPSDNNAPIIDITTDIWPVDWRDFNVNVSTRYLTFTKVNSGGRINEIAICGTPSTGGSSCTDGIQNGNETGVDCGGSCSPCVDPASCTDGIQNGNETGIDCGGSCPPCDVGGSCEINITPQMFFDEFGNSATGTNDAGSLADEQTIIGDPINGQGNDTEVPWLYPWGNDVKSYIDLGQVYNISSIHLFDGFGTGQFLVSTGLPQDNNPAIIDITTDLWPPAWRDFEVTVAARYLTFTKVTTSAKINEIAICGTPATGGPSCTDGIQNGNETGVDCGGSCTPCVDPPTCTDGIQNGNETGVDCGGNCSPCDIAGDCQVPLNPLMFFDANGNQVAGNELGGSLADEQASIGDPINGQGNEVDTPWKFPWDNNVQTYIDLGQEFDISSIHLYDGYGTGEFQVAPGRPSDNLNPIIDITTDIWPPSWRSFDNLQVTNRYLTFTRVTPNAKINEISICATPSASAIARTTNKQDITSGEKLVVFPNPTTGKLRVIRPEKWIKELKIIDTNGRVVIAKKYDENRSLIELDVSEIQNGIYFVYVNGDEKTAPVFTRFVKLGTE